MKSTTLICKRCKAPLQYEEGSSVAVCQNCGCKVLIDETEAMKIERIKAKAVKDMAIEKSKLEKDAEIEKKKISLEQKRLELRIIHIILMVVAGLAAVSLISFICYRIAHHNERKIPQDFTYYTTLNYDDAKDSLLGSGFTDVELIEEATLDKSKMEQVGIVAKVSIGGQDVFYAGDWFKKDLPIEITYKSLDPKRADDVEMPISSVDCNGQQYNAIIDMLKKAGFKNVETVVIKNLTLNQKTEEGKITEIAIGNNSDFHKGDYYSPTDTIIIKYHMLDPERSTDVRPPRKYDKYIDEDFRIVISEFRKAGFENITLTPLYDINAFQGSDNGKVQSVKINTDEVFLQKDLFSRDSEVNIRYRTRKLKYTNVDYKEITEELSKIGFTSITAVPLNDLEIDEMKDVDKTASILIGNEEFENCVEMNLLTPVCINYHSEKQASNDQVKITVNSKELKGLDYQEVVNNLKGMGFTNIKTEPLSDQKKDDSEKIGKTEEIIINGKKKFSAGEIFEKTDEVIVTYHSKKEDKKKKTDEVEETIEVEEGMVLTTTSAKDLKGRDYNDVINELKGMGFSQIQEKPLEDLKKGWLYKEGEVKEVSIDGDVKFSANMSFDENAEVIVMFHSYPK